MKKIAGPRGYSEAFKKQVVTDIESGQATVSAIRRKYGIGGATTVLKWLKRYGTGSKRVVSGGAVDRSAVTERRVLILEREKRELEAALSRAVVEKVVLQGLIDEAEAQLGISIKKNFGKGR